MPVSQELLDLLVCPQCKGELEVSPAKDWLVCHACKLKYAIEKDYPNMLIEDAVPLEK